MRLDGRRLLASNVRSTLPRAGLVGDIVKSDALLSVMEFYISLHAPQEDMSLMVSERMVHVAIWGSIIGYHIYLWLPS